MFKLKVFYFVILFLSSLAFADNSILKSEGDWLSCASQGLGADTGSDYIKLGVYKDQLSSKWIMKMMYPDFPDGRVYEYSGNGIMDENTMRVLFSPGDWLLTGMKTSDGYGVINGDCFKVRLQHKDQSFYYELVCDIRRD